MGIKEIIIRLILTFFALLMLTKFMGRKEISQMTLFNFVSAMAIGTLGGALVIDPALSIRNGLFALLGWTILTLIMGFLDIKSQKFRTFVDGEPVIVVKQGKIMEKALRKVQLDIDSLRTMLRQKDIFSFADVEYAIFEVDGKLSIIKKDMILPRGGPQAEVFPPVPTEIISDGIINLGNLAKLNLNQQWLEDQLKQSGITSITNVFYAEIKQDGSLYIDRRKDLIT